MSYLSFMDNKPPKCVRLKLAAKLICSVGKLKEYRAYKSMLAGELLRHAELALIREDARAAARFALRALSLLPYVDGSKSPHEEHAAKIIRCIMASFGKDNKRLAYSLAYAAKQRIDGGNIGGIIVELERLGMKLPV